MQENRREPRVSYKALSLPFMGVRMPDHLHFQYLLVDASDQGIQIAIPDWVVAWDHFVQEDEVMLCLPVSLGNNMLELCKVCWKKQNQETREQYLGLVQQKAEGKTPLFIITSNGILEFADNSAKLNSNKLVLRLIKDACLLKRGVKIYLEHFLPYFSRLAKDAQHYDEMRSFMLNEALELVDKNISILENLMETVKSDGESSEQFTTNLDMSILQRAFQSEVHHGLFQTAFPNESLLNYVEEIKKLEFRLFQNYNTLIILQIMTLEKAFI